MRTKDVLRSLTPPVLWQVARRLKLSGASYRAPWEGPYSSWEAAMSKAAGWDSPLITEKTLAAALRVRDGTATVERDGVVLNRIPYSATILAFLLMAFARRKDRLDIIDFGGGLGSNYYQNRRILLRLHNTTIRWHIVERPVFADLGTQHFQSSELSFSSNLAELLSTEALEAKSILFSGSLQYVSEPFSILTQVARSSIKLVALDRVLTSPSPGHAIFVQNPSPKTYYGANYPVWCFSRDKLFEWFAGNGFALVEHFTVDPETNFDHCGMIFVRR